MISRDATEAAPALARRIDARVDDDKTILGYSRESADFNYDYIRTYIHIQHALLPTRSTETTERTCKHARGFRVGTFTLASLEYVPVLIRVCYDYIINVILNSKLSKH